MLSSPQERPPLLDQEGRQKLPALYSQEGLGLQAQALVKFFTPDSNWTWYASEGSVLFEDDTYHVLSEIDVDDPRIASTVFFA